MENLNKYFPDVNFCQDVQICGIKNISICPGSCIGKDVWLNICVQDKEKRIKIGKCVLVGRRGMVSTGSFLEIGDYTTIGPNCYIGNVDHDFRNFGVPLLRGGITISEKLTIEENCWLAFNCVITGGITIGRGSVVGANTVVNRNIEPFSVVVGNPCKVVKMYDPVEENWLKVKDNSDFEKIMNNRNKKPLPNREQYREILSKSGLERIDKLVGGGPIHLE